VFGAQAVTQIDTEKQWLPEKDTEASRIVRKVIDYIHVGRQRRMKVRAMHLSGASMIQARTNW